MYYFTITHCRSNILTVGLFRTCSFTVLEQSVERAKIWTRFCPVHQLSGVTPLLFFKPHSWPRPLICMQPAQQLQSWTGFISCCISTSVTRGRWCVNYCERPENTILQAKDKHRPRSCYCCCWWWCNDNRGLHRLAGDHRIPLWDDPFISTEDENFAQSTARSIVWELIRLFPFSARWANDRLNPIKLTCNPKSAWWPALLTASAHLTDVGQYVSSPAW